MHYSKAALVALTGFLSLSSAAPTKRQSVTDADVLQYALTLEHLENAFYKKALSMMDVKAFTDAGFSAEFYDQLKFIAHDEEAHVVYLEAGLTAAGAAPVAACEYAFPMTTPEEFVALASVIEGLGVSAYLGAAGFITEKAYLTAAASILATEALHQSAQRNAVGEIPMANPLATPLGINAVYSMAANFITSCPSTNAALPAMAYPALAAKSGMPTAPGALVDLIPATMPEGTYFATFASGLDVLPVKVSSAEGGMLMVEVPMNISGQSYVFITSDDSGMLSDSNIMFGPAILEVTPSSPTFDLTIL